MMLGTAKLNLPCPSSQVPSRHKQLIIGRGIFMMFPRFLCIAYFRSMFVTGAQQVFLEQVSNQKLHFSLAMWSQWSVLKTVFGIFSFKEIVSVQLWLQFSLHMCLSIFFNDSLGILYHVPQLHSFPGPSVSVLHSCSFPHQRKQNSKTKQNILLLCLFYLTIVSSFVAVALGASVVPQYTHMPKQFYCKYSLQ